MFYVYLVYVWLYYNTTIKKIHFRYALMTTVVEKKMIIIKIKKEKKKYIVRWQITKNRKKEKTDFDLNDDFLMRIPYKAYMWTMTIKNLCIWC